MSLKALQELSLVEITPEIEKRLEEGRTKTREFDKYIDEQIRVICVSGKLLRRTCNWGTIHG